MTEAELDAEAEALQAAEMWGPRALAVNERLVAVSPDHPAAAVRAARCLRALGRTDESAAMLARFLATQPSHGVARSQLKNTMLRRTALRRAEELASRDPRLLFAELEAAKGAERDFDFQVEGRRLLARRERSVSSACALGAAQRRARDLDGARNTYQWAWQQDADPRSNPMAHIGLAAVLRDQRQWNDAERIYRGVLHVTPGNTHAQLGLAAVLMDRAERLGQRECLDECRTLLGRLWASNPNAQVSAAYGRLKSLGA